MVDKIFYLNSDKFPAIAQDYSDIQTRLENHKNNKNHSEPSVFAYAIESIPTFRRTASLDEKIENGEYAATTGVLGLTLVNIKEDWRDVVSAAKQIYSKINPNYHYDPLYNRHDYQHGFSFTKGLIGERWLHSQIDKNNKFAEKLYELDKTIDDTKFGRFVKDVLGIDKIASHKVEKIKNARGDSARAYKFSSKIFGGEITARAMKRTTLAGVLVAAAIEAPSIIKAATQGDNFFEQGENCAKQTVKSSISLASATAGIAYGGAIGAKYGGAAGSIIGMGAGAIFGSKIANKVQEAIS